MEMGNMDLGTKSGRVSVTSAATFFLKATCESSSFGKQMVLMGHGYIGTAAPGEVGRVVLGL